MTCADMGISLWNGHFDLTTGLWKRFVRILIPGIANAQASVQYRDVVDLLCSLNGNYGLPRSSRESDYLEMLQISRGTLPPQAQDNADNERDGYEAFRS